jgi:hypothetical protein
MYKDCRGQWDIDIEFLEEKIIITHKKWEMSLTGEFEFCWNLGLVR